MSEVPFFLIVVFIFIVIVIIRSRELPQAIIAFFTGKPTPLFFDLFPSTLPSRYRKHLEKNDKYYRNLPPKLQRAYENRVMKFIAGKSFNARGKFHLTNEIVAMIASAAVKITFGIRNFEFSLFHSIIVYADEFYSNASNQYLKGETNAGGVIVFSWNDLKFGMDNPNDAINLGYHEFAHAFFLDNLMKPYNNEFKDHYREWLVYIKNNDLLEKVQQKHIFRDYASVNEMEFFAVSLENFFENPIDFKQNLPKLYQMLTKMLNQDPTMQIPIVNY